MLKKKRFIPQLNDITPSDEDFASLLATITTSHVKEGTVVKGQVVETSQDVIVVDVGLKNEGRIPVSEFQLVPNQALPKVGDIVDVFVEKVEGRRGTVLSREKAIREESWVKLEELFDTAARMLWVLSSAELKVALQLIYVAWWLSYQVARLM
jgi:small subunit ribosomal protein S1